MATSSASTAAPQEPYVVPDCGCGEAECFGPEPVPWLSWKHCFKIYDFRTALTATQQTTSGLDADVALESPLIGTTRLNPIARLVLRHRHLPREPVSTASHS